MYKQACYSKYQKKVIKLLNDLLGVETPFSFEKAQNNHLKVLIDGVPKPLFTGSTPSDTKALNNFIAEVKRSVAQSKTEALQALAAEDSVQLEQEAKSIFSPIMQNTIEKTIQTCLKSLRPRIDSMKQKEEAMVVDTASLDCIKEFRLNEIKNAVKLALNAQKATSYIKPKEMKNLENKILEHVDFWLPTLADYAQLIDKKPQKVSIDSGIEAVQAKPVVQPVADTSNVVAIEDAATSEAVKTQVVKPKAKPVIKEVACKTSFIVEFMKMSSSRRVDALRELSKPDATLLISEINQAMSLNRERDIQLVISMMNDKGLGVDDILSALNSAESEAV